MSAQVADIAAIDGACRILGADKVQVYLLAGLSAASIVAHANSVAKAKMEAEAMKGQIDLDAVTRAAIMSGRLKFNGRPPELRNVRP